MASRSIFFRSNTNGRQWKVTGLRCKEVHTPKAKLLSPAIVDDYRFCQIGELLNVDPDDHVGKPESFIDSIKEKVTETFHDHDSPSSSDSDDGDKKRSTHSSSVKSKIYRLFRREKHVHKVLGGGKPTDNFLWRNNKISAGVLWCFYYHVGAF